MDGATDSLAEVQRISEEVEEVIARHKAAIRQARADGYSLRQIADAARLSHQTIKRFTTEEEAGQ
jgi:DNA-directed RNA polymerase specialized sigma24 family protein